MMRCRALLFLLLTSSSAGLFSPSRADAQFAPGGSYGIGIGFYSGSRGLNSPYYGSGFGIYPLWYNGFYGNGMSMYGPPVPTYSPVPGTFGGSDYRVNQNAPFYTGAGWMYRSPSYRVPANVPVPMPGNPINPNEPQLLNEKVLGGPEAHVLMVEVHVPLENATVFFNNQVTRTNGNVRMFASPPLKPGETYQYDVKAEWIINGQKTSLSHTVKGKAGETVVADFGG